MEKSRKFRSRLRLPSSVSEIYGCPLRVTFHVTKLSGRRTGALRTGSTGVVIARVSHRNDKSFAMDCSATDDPLFKQLPLGIVLSNKLNMRGKF